VEGDRAEVILPLVEKEIEKRVDLVSKALALIAMREVIAVKDL
jgi:hypothetical protein